MTFSSHVPIPGPVLVPWYLDPDPWPCTRTRTCTHGPVPITRTHGVSPASYDTVSLLIYWNGGITGRISLITDLYSASVTSWTAMIDQCSWVATCILHITNKGVAIMNKSQLPTSPFKRNTCMSIENVTSPLS